MDETPYFEETPPVSFETPEEPAKRPWPAVERLYKIFPEEETRYAGCGRGKGKRMMR